MKPLPEKIIADIYNEGIFHNSMIAAGIDLTFAPFFWILAERLT